MKNVRVRFAPSPTGPLHIGGVRTVLYNYLFAKKNGGKLILRIEDTDQNRFVEGAEKYIIESLKWCGIKFDESIAIGGEFGPYKQSERKEIYAKFVKQLIENDKAYYAFDTSEELEEMRNRLKSEKRNPQYDSISRKSMKNSLSLSAEEVKKKLDSGENYVVRIKIPENEDIEILDMIRGKVVVNSSKLDDKVLFKSDGMPTYHLANIVDDHLMEISHVIRGEEWLPSAPLHVLLYRFFGWEAPEFAHLPLLLKPNGNGKLSKRDGDRLGFPVFPLQWIDPKTNEVSSGYREGGYFPEAFINMLALLGWNSGTEQELFTMDELIEAFSIDRVGKSGSKFDPEKAKWFNHQYLIAKSDDELAGLYLRILENKGIKTDYNFVKTICGLIKERASFVEDFWDQSNFFFQAPDSYDSKIVKKKWKENTPQILIEIINRFENIDTFIAENIENSIKDYLFEKNLGMGQVMNVIRLSLVGSNKGPDLFTIIELIGKKEVVKRVNSAINRIEK